MRNSKSRISWFLFAAAMVIAPAYLLKAQSFTATHAKISLLIDGSSLKPGQMGWMGLYFEMEPGWHIYWLNPGDSGEPPQVQWDLPKGFKPGEIRWPVPVRLTTGSVIDYGYQGHVLLALPVDVPASYNPRTPAKLSADLRYLICREVCIPAKGHAELVLPANKGAAPDEAASRRIFQDARAHWPEMLPAGAKAQVVDNGKSLVLSVDAGPAESKAFFFPLEEDQVDNDAPQTVTTAGTRTQFTLKKSPQLQKPLPVLKGVVAFPDRAYEIAAPVSSHR